MYRFLLILVFLFFMCKTKITEGFNILLSPMSNSELDFIPERWNRSDIQTNNNCYAYATDDIDPRRTVKPHPGFKENIETTKKEFTCDVLTPNVFKDHPGAYQTTFENQCKCNYYKAYLTVDPSKDFHLYRQDSDGYWSHKPGSLKATNLDASKQKITNPEIADRTYKRFNYTDSCMFFCVPSSKSCED
jgi:hypothetical protein